ncbi:sensor histidine kinase [Citricoccus sp. SGAir0253]|uniref:sensor histidine kinase n=1 Tax=Citricoccus sp. SGAir0253 TaxID=2567881 RepID=UPI0010CD0D8F|nr:histidine kinase [Citricoccus sp. SGAir0253]QCU79106.1 sensor histidine kinase [Citricoccus sp. SGAir0253]
MNPLHRLDTWSRRHPVLVDSLVAAGLLAFLALLSVGAVVPFESTTVGHFLWGLLALACAVGQLAPWAIRRWRPVLSAGIVVSACLLQLVLGPELLPSLIAVPMTVHNLAVNGPRWASLAGIGTALAGAVLNGLKIAYVGAPGFADDGSALGRGAALAAGGTTERLAAGAGAAVAAAAIVLAAWAFGDLARTRRLALEQLRDRARRLEVEAARERALAAADERNHIAREMHDIVAHSLQVIITQADGGRYAGARDPAVAVGTLQTVSDTGRRALGEMRRLLGVLRGPESLGFHPQPGLADLDELVETIRLTGLEVDFTTEGTPRRELPAGGELAAYRAVQEALTNTVRHGGPEARAAVRLCWTGRGLEIGVEDDGRGAAASPETRGAGQGLLGLRERIALFGGTATAGPRPGGGFGVHATVPYQEV